jgi:hypothetical protein
MPPRYAYWTILADGLPTAFRAGDREELLPTFNRIKAKHPDAEMKYFARGKLWASPEDVQRDAAARERRDADWRPGGTHRDPRQPYEDARKARNLKRRKTRFERSRAPRPGEPVEEKPHGDPLRPKLGGPRTRNFRSKPKQFSSKPRGTPGPASRSRSRAGDAAPRRPPRRDGPGRRRS